MVDLYDEEEAGLEWLKIMSAKRTERVCQVCGNSFFGGKDIFYCPGCARAKKLDTVVQIRTCKDCGIEFYGGPRAMRCPDCAHKAQQETSRRHKKRGTMRPLGSNDKCVICGKEYIVVSGRQKYCSDFCQRKGVLEWQREHKKGYSKASRQDIKKQERRNQVQKVCVYCLRTFKSDKPTNLCSDYCKSEQKKIKLCESDMKRGYKRNYSKYIDKRDKYREDIKNKL